MQPLRDLFHATLGKWTSPPPIPDAAFPPGHRLIPRGHELVEHLWQTMWYDALSRGLLIGVVAMLVLDAAIKRFKGIARAS